MEISVTGNNDAGVHEATAPHYQYGIKSKPQDKCKPDFCVSLVAHACRSWVIGHLLQQFSTVSEAELEVHYDIDLQGWDEEDADQSRLAIASPIKSQSKSFKRSKPSQRTISMQTDVECQGSA